jgi:hypothetical protein
LPWALAHSEDVADLDLACDFVDLAIAAYPDFRLFAERNKPAIDQHRQVLKNSAATRNETRVWSRNTAVEQAWLDDAENLPIWAGGKASFSSPLMSWQASGFGLLPTEF